LQKFTGAGQHEYFAVDAGVEMLAETMGRVVKQAQIRFTDIDDLHFEAVFLLHGLGIFVPTDKEIVIEKGCDKFETNDPYPLIGDHSAGQD
jgi:hypothetical protein